MIRLSRLIPAVAFSAVSAQASGSEVTLEQTAWPAARPCGTCITLQFGVLEFQLPQELAGKIFVPSHDAFPVQILPKGATDARTSVVLMGSTEGAYMDKYARVHLDTATMSAVNFFDLIGRPALKGSGIAHVRTMEGLDHATSYTKASKGKVHAYWVRSRPGYSQYLHLMIVGSRDVYSFVGGVTPQLYSAILSNLNERPEP